MRTKVAWFSRHEMNNWQLNDLRVKYGNDLILVQVRDRLEEIEDFFPIIEACDVICVVGNWGVIADFAAVCLPEKELLIPIGRYDKVTGIQKHERWDLVVRAEYITKPLL